MEKAAALFGKKPRQVTSWMYGERLPRPSDALMIERVSKGKVRMADIYRTQ